MYLSEKIAFSKYNDFFDKEQMFEKFVICCYNKLNDDV